MTLGIAPQLMGTPGTSGIVWAIMPARIPVRTPCSTVMRRARAMSPAGSPTHQKTTVLKDRHRRRRVRGKATPLKPLRRARRLDRTVRRLVFQHGPAVVTAPEGPRIGSSPRSMMRRNPEVVVVGILVGRDEIEALVGRPPTASGLRPRGRAAPPSSFGGRVSARYRDVTSRNMTPRRSTLPGAWQRKQPWGAAIPSLFNPWSSAKVMPSDSTGDRARTSHQFVARPARTAAAGETSGPRGAAGSRLFQAELPLQRSCHSGPRGPPDGPSLRPSGQRAP